MEQLVLDSESGGLTDEEKRALVVEAQKVLRDAARRNLQAIVDSPQSRLTEPERAFLSTVKLAVVVNGCSCAPPPPRTPPKQSPTPPWPDGWTAA